MTYPCCWLPLLDICRGWRTLPQHLSSWSWSRSPGWRSSYEARRTSWGQVCSWTPPVRRDEAISLGHDCSWLLPVRNQQTNQFEFHEKANFNRQIVWVCSWIPPVTNTIVFHVNGCVNLRDKHKVHLFDPLGYPTESENIEEASRPFWTSDFRGRWLFLELCTL